MLVQGRSPTGFIQSKIIMYKPSWHLFPSPGLATCPPLPFIHLMKMYEPAGGVYIRKAGVFAFIYEGNPPKFKQHTSSCHRTNCQKEFQVMGCYGMLWGMHRHCLGFVLVGVWFRWSPQGFQYWWYPRAFDHKFAVVHSHDLFTVHIWDGFVSLFIGWYLPAIKHGNVHRSGTFLWKQEIRI